MSAGAIQEGPWREGKVVLGLLGKESLPGCIFAALFCAPSLTLAALTADLEAAGCVPNACSRLGRCGPPLPHLGAALWGEILITRVAFCYTPKCMQGCSQEKEADTRS